MPLYRWNAENLEPVPPATFEAEQLQERSDLQRMHRNQPDVIEEGLFVVAEEFGNWEDSNRRINLLAIDSEARLTVIELKRTESGDHMDLQAIRYAAMASNITLDQLVDAHSAYMSALGIEGSAEERIVEHLTNSDNSETGVDSQRPRIFLASAGFSKELTTTVLWLRDVGINISCVKLQLYRNSDGLLLNSSQVIPLPEASEYLIRVREKQEERQYRILGRQRMAGDADFLESIKRAHEDAQLELKRLHAWAVKMKKEGLAELETFLGKYTLLQLKLPSANSRPVAIYNMGESSHIRIGGDALERFAPRTLEQIKKIVYPRIIGTGNSIPEPSNELLDALTDAYREANGLPPTTPRPDTLPDNPAAAK